MLILKQTYICKNSCENFAITWTANMHLGCRSSLTTYDPCELLVVLLTGDKVTEVEGSSQRYSYIESLYADYQFKSSLR